MTERKITTVTYNIDVDDPKSFLRVVRDDLKRILASPSATNIESGKKKLRFYNWCLEHEEGVDRFKEYALVKRYESEEAGFQAAGWADK